MYPYIHHHHSPFKEPIQQWVSYSSTYYHPLVYSTAHSNIQSRPSIKEVTLLIFHTILLQPHQSHNHMIMGRKTENQRQQTLREMEIQQEERKLCEIQAKKERKQWQLLFEQEAKERKKSIRIWSLCYWWSQKICRCSDAIWWIKGSCHKGKSKVPAISFLPGSFSLLSNMKMLTRAKTTFRNITKINLLVHLEAEISTFPLVSLSRGNLVTPITHLAAITTVPHREDHYHPIILLDRSKEGDKNKSGEPHKEPTIKIPQTKRLLVLLLPNSRPARTSVTRMMITRITLSISLNKMILWCSGR